MTMDPSPPAPHTPSVTLPAAPQTGARWRRIQAIYAGADREWSWFVFVAWAIISAIYLSRYAPQMHWMSLGDTDDNMRYLQVRDWLNGQSWWDLRQHRMDPPHGANIHWSRIVDLPIAALMLTLKPLFGAVRGEQLALGIAPLLPLFPLMLALAFATRRLSDGGIGWLVAALLPLSAEMALGMYMPMRVDHHGWQLALTAITLAGIVDDRAVRGGIVAGVASALSIAIGMEMMVYLAAGGAIIVLRWIVDDGAGRRMVPYAIALAGTTALGYLLFASEANRLPMCDALSPVWTTLLVMAGALMLLLAFAPLPRWPLRLAAAMVGGAGLLLFAWSLWPQCLTGAYQLSPELQAKWLVYIREAKPITQQARNVWLPLVSLPFVGGISALVACWILRRDRDRLWAITAFWLVILLSTALLFWQIRAGPAAQLLAIPPAAWAAGALLNRIVRGPALHRLGAALFVLLLALPFCAYPLYPHFAPFIGNSKELAKEKAKAAAKPKGKKKASATALCRTQPALQVLDQLPPALIFTMVDLGPRILATTHHSVVAGPYHRNEKAILDVHHAMDGQADGFRPIAAAHGARYLLICPGFAEGTIYQARSPRGFYAQMIRGNVPAWLEPVTLKAGEVLPYSLYRIDYTVQAKAPQDRRAAKN
ncbi:hypothetical protein LWE61_09600 [Sphingobium sufflavum]|uniref:hypothetical protein n=1 Tax=Sphingobium sufflavum TaxID=1129547 RepID=UPI001F420A2D|nr:hypothetical protein [Sphingobium sufflavum]MCE7796811.1 hypothetical protein [Sphingobium sufflavum]